MNKAYLEITIKVPAKDRAKAGAVYSKLVHGKTDQRGFFAVGLGLALFAVFAATGWGLVTLVGELPQTAAGPEIHAASATSEPAGRASAP